MTRVYQYYQRRIALLSLFVIAAWVGLGFKLFSIKRKNSSISLDLTVLNLSCRECIPGTHFQNN